MAIYHLQVKTISRSAGRSATAAAAYRSASLVRDERTGLTHDYRRKTGVGPTLIVTPTDAPVWASDREQLWNQAEASETRKNSTVAREFEVSLPAELSQMDRTEVAYTLARELSQRHSVAVDLAIHAPSKGGDQRNHHAHLLLTTRQLGADGFGKKTRELDDRKRGRVEIKYWRERWAEIVNHHMEKAGLDERVDHRSHKDRGIDQEPTIHVGPEATIMERRGETTRRGDYNRGVIERNQHRRSSARELAEAEAEYKTAQRRSQQAREQARRQQPPAPSPAHGSAAVAMDQGRASADRLADRLLGVDDAVAQQEQQNIRERALAEMRRHVQAEKAREQAARERALAGLAKFRRIVGPRAAEISAQAAANVKAVQVEQQLNNEAQREHEAARPRAPGMLGRMVGGSGRYQRQVTAWREQARDLLDAGRRLRESYEAERQRHGSAGQIAAQELARSNPDLVRLAEKGMVIEEADRKAREVERQRQREVTRQEQAQAKQPGGGGEQEQKNKRNKPRRSRGPSMGM